MTEQHNGEIPSPGEVEKTMKNFTPYLDNGVTDVSQIMKAQKIAEERGIDHKDMALMTAIGKERGLTADVLSDEKKAAKEQAKLEHTLYRKTGNRDAAKRKAEYEMNVLKELHGVDNNLDSQRPIRRR